MNRACKRTILFIAPLACIAIALELCLSSVNRYSHGRFRIGEDVYQTLQAADAPHPQVTTLYLGDSVARQLFDLDSEPSPKLLYLPSNQAISVAGQYCILQTVMAHSPHLQHVYLMYAPHSWANDLDQILTHDYFCGYFHTPSLVWEIWNFKHDLPLTEAHVGRLLLPNIMAENSYLNRSQSNSGVPIVATVSRDKSQVSATSYYFVDRMRVLCRQRQIKFTILPCPCVGTPGEFDRIAPIYDAPITLYDASLFLPMKVHFQDQNVAAAREGFIEKFHLRDLP